MLRKSVSSSPRITQREEQDVPVYTPMPWSLKEIRASIPTQYFVRDTARSLAYVLRDVLMAAGLVGFVALADVYLHSASATQNLGVIGTNAAQWGLWATYWWFQGLIFTGTWILGHECGHGAFSPHKRLNDTVGFILHSFLLTPYYSWKISHHSHHLHHASMEKDEVYIPATRNDLGIPKEVEHSIDFEHYFGDTAIYTLLVLIIRQAISFPLYLLFNISGQASYPKFTNHFSPNSVIFTKGQRNAVIMSDIGLLTTMVALHWAGSIFGSLNVIKYYVVPWVLSNHWLVLITYLHHTDPEVPHYRGKEWNFVRGAASTVDRPFLGWQGRFFLHDISHYHVVHHFFPKMPFYHGREATQHLKAFLGPYYVSCDKPAFKALWDNYSKCKFVEDEGEILFYKDKQGRAVRRPQAVS
ncbi:fatty acid desaturase-domain-containing protein [Hygrophoropsis aurantiaca]|uniref:Fatty acid desaturase-domain-containing protein n=1 Tax=Hygrophoropsis aurantiaca TaxID=72124 RepID=A0ACB8ATK5_9AGAM|nr:fatty acid desaturase-domain-containing protein [Hygrophoropsis aurantiaca]